MCKASIHLGEEFETVDNSTSNRSVCRGEFAACTRVLNFKTDIYQTNLYIRNPLGRSNRQE